ncbi:MAG TPA: hypothetical protein VG937_38385 [Polyangiaceae bacterium]|nr:hypothetical protein [Polyangiaceae bacterium]
MFRAVNGACRVSLLLPFWLAACGNSKEGTTSSFGSGGSSGAATSGGVGSGGSTAMGGTSGGTSTTTGGRISIGGQTQCKAETCAEKGWACGSFVNSCGNITNCADEGRACGALEACVGGKDMPAKCVTGFESCEVCSKVPDCKAQGTPTRLTGRVITPGRSDTDTMNQVGVPNAVVYILRSNDPAMLPAMTAGIPAGGTSCDRCEDQKLGPTLIGTVTDATGRFTLEGAIPVGTEFLLAVKVGKFRRVVKYSLPATAACATTTLPATLPDNPTRLPRASDDGIAVNIPRIAVTTGEVDAMECVLEKMGLAHNEFGNPAPAGPAVPHVQLYRGAPLQNGGGKADALSGARIDDMTPADTTLYGDLAQLSSYDFVIADCESTGWDEAGTQRTASGANVREYVNRGGRLFASHLGFTWLDQNGTATFDPAAPIATGLGPAATWSTTADGQSTTGNGVISIGRPNASPRIDNFAQWMAAENVVTPPMNNFTIQEPRSQNTGLGTSSEEFVFREDGNGRVQQFSFNTPYGAPANAVCGRVAYSGFHVSIGTTSSAVFPAHCTGNLTNQEKVLLYMIFDLGACIGEPPPPPDCKPETCQSIGALCGLVGDGCGNVVNCGTCPPPR